MFDLIKKLLGINRACPHCGGRGQWQETTFDPTTGLSTTKTFYCESCKGRGIVTNDEDIDDFDLGGVGTTEFDEEDDE
jgi:hypothetical protein